jgi:hypothetical protein
LLTYPIGALFWSTWFSVVHFNSATSDTGNALKRERRFARLGRERATRD